MLPWPTNMFMPGRKNITGVEIDSWPRFGHIFVPSTFSKLPKILWKWRISMESQAQSKSYLKALAKGQHEMKKQSFWPKNVILANTCSQNTWKSFPAKIWPPLLPRKSSKIKKYDEIHAYWIQVHREDFHLGFEVGQGPRSSIKCFLGLQIRLGRGAKAL